MKTDLRATTITNQSNDCRQSTEVRRLGVGRMAGHGRRRDVKRRVIEPQSSTDVHD